MCSSSLYFHPPYAKPLDCISVQSNWLFVFTSTFQNSSHIHFPQRPRFCGIQYRSSSLKSSSHASCVCRRHSDLQSLSVVWRWPSYTAGVCLHSRGFAVDEGKPAAAESSQDRVSWCASYVNTMISTDPSCRWCFGIASHYRPVSWCPVHINADITMTLLMRSNFIWHRAGQLFSSARPSPAIVKKGQPKRGGGLAFIYNIQLSVKPIKSSLVPKTFELQLVGVQVANIIVKVANIYRPPGLSKSAFLDEFADLLASLGSGTGERLIICGDLNIPSLDAVNIDERLTSLLDIHGYQQHVTQSTRHDPRQLPLRRDNLLDLVITSTLMHLQVRWFLTLRYSTHTVRLTTILS